MTFTHRTLLALALTGLGTLGGLAQSPIALAQSPSQSAVPIDSPWNPASTPPQAFHSPQIAIQNYLKALPGLPPNLVVVPATGTIPWPGLALAENVPAEVWTVVQDHARNKPLMMFAVNLLNGEVYAIHLRPLPKGPVVSPPAP